MMLIKTQQKKHIVHQFFWGGVSKGEPLIFFGSPKDDLSDRWEIFDEAVSPKAHRKMGFG